MYCNVLLSLEFPSNLRFFFFPVHHVYHLTWSGFDPTSSYFFRYYNADGEVTSTETFAYPLKDVVGPRLSGDPYDRNTRDSKLGKNMCARSIIIILVACHARLRGENQSMIHTLPCMVQTIWFLFLSGVPGQNSLSRYGVLKGSEILGSLI